MTATNEHTGDRITTKRSTIYAENYGNIDFTIKLETEQTKENKSLLNHLLKDDTDGFTKD
jgi:hypothetical protein